MATNSKRLKLSESKRRNKTSQSQRAIAQGFPIVGIGASAGGLEAFTELLTHLPPDTGLGFVLVQHLDPQHESILSHLLARATSMPVREVTNNLRVEPNHVYVIPPNTNLSIVQGVLKLQPRENTGTHRSIDFFFTSLAEDQRERAIGVILSGTATDGTHGLETIKSEGGIVFAQDDSAKYDSMPRSAIAAGCVDLVLPPRKIALELARIARHPYVADRSMHAELERANDELGGALASGGKGMPRTGSTQARRETKVATVHVEDSFRRILVLLRNHAGVDFSLYKSATIRRRITRRMVLNKLGSLGDYVGFLKGNAAELDLLYSDVLISVTSFFRNPEAFEVLKRKVFPKLLAGRRQDDPVRVWTLGCSTGQEAYSIAMAYTEFAADIHGAPYLQIFATDLNDALLEKARQGLYAKSLAGDISPERLRRFFVEEQGGYRIAKSLRELCVFARQNILSDPPFSRMDLISCRNLLIYIEPHLQKKIFPNFHYALKPGGFLFLGASESVGAFTHLFEPADKKQKIFSKRPGPSPTYHQPVARQRGEDGRGSASPLRPAHGTRPVWEADARAESNAQREADRLVSRHFSPPGVLVNAQWEVLQFRGATSAYLEPPAGKASFNLLKMARPALMLPLRAALNQAKKQNRPTIRKNARLENGAGAPKAVDIEVIPLKNLKEICYLVLFKSAPPHQTGEAKTGSKRAVSPPVKESARLAELERELAETRDFFQSLQEQHEAASEELQASNEEVQSANEELQSINEELETSKEELESTNEELITVNEEMSARNADLSRLNSDLNNLHVSINTAILVLSRDLTVRWFTPSAEKVFNLRADDLGLALSGIRHNLNFPDLGKFLTEVIDNVSVREREVQDRDGRWFMLRARPYVTQDNKIDGALLILTDIDNLKFKERELEESRDYAQAIVETVPPLLILDQDLRVMSANDSFYKHFDAAPAQTENVLIYELGRGQWNVPKLRTLLEGILPRNSFFEDFEVTLDFGNRGARNLLLSARRLDHTHRILLSIEDTTERMQLEACVRRSEVRYRRLFEAARYGILILDSTTHKITEANPFVAELLGYAPEQLIGKELWETGLFKDAEANREAFQILKEKGVLRFNELLLKTQSGESREVEFVSNLYQEGGQEVIQCNLRDITERRQAERALQLVQAQLANRAGLLEQAVSERTQELMATNKQMEAFVYSIAHDLRAPLRSMQGFSEILMEEAGPNLSGSCREYAQRISHSAQFMDAMLLNLLAFSRVSQQQIELVSVNLERVVQSELAALEKEIREKSARVEAPGPWPAALAHELTLGQVLFNLINNALKFVRPDVPPRIRLRAEELQDSPVPMVRVWVEDNGIGIKPEYLDQIFRLFTRLNRDKFPGTGFGLAIVQKGIERMGGQVGVESIPNQGSRFWFELRKA